MKVIVTTIALVALFVVSSKAHFSGESAPPCNKCNADCINLQEFDKYACECYCPYGRRGPSWGCDSNKLWDRTSCDCACKATAPAAGCGLGEWNKERCACYCPRPEGPTPSGKTWMRHPTCAYVCKNPKPANLPAFKRWNEDKCRVECIPTKPDPIPAGKRWCEDCCELSCIAKPPCSLAIPANKHWDTKTCSIECINLKPAVIPDKKQWNDVTCELECKDPVPAFDASIKKWDTETCSVVCKTPKPDVIQANKQWNENTCTLECTSTASGCKSPQTLDPVTCSCTCPNVVTCAGGKNFNNQFCSCVSNTLSGFERIHFGEYVVSTSGCFYLTLDASGDAVLYKKDGTDFWRAGVTGGNSIYMSYYISAWYVISQDGNTIWQASSARIVGSKLILQDSGDLQVVLTTGIAHWQSNTTQSVTTC